MNQWIRVSKQHPCPVCGHSSWCLVSGDLGAQVVLCMRVQSDKPKQFSSGETGWLHNLDLSRMVFPRTKEFTKKHVDCLNLMTRWYEETKPWMREQLAKSLGVMPWTLDDNGGLGSAFAKEHRAWAFPMWDGTGGIVGIRLRAANGKKWTVKDTHTGIFIPLMNAQRRCLICEGPTDTAAAMSLGYYAVGRPSCSGGAMHLKLLFSRVKVTEAIIVADNDEPGLNGAKGLSDLLLMPSTIICLSCKDIREFIKLGGTKQVLDNLINHSIWDNP